MFETPILFLIFNRPNTTEEVFERIRQIKPKYLFVAADGPRIHVEGEIELCNKTRAVINNIDWDCDLKLLFREENLGCGKGPSNAINWFFNYVENGIILEDDCLPDISFFNFCEDLLECYKNEPKLMHIGGTNSQFGKLRGKYSYYFSKYPHIWGWATWRDRWAKFKFSFTDEDEAKLHTIFKEYKFTEKEIKYWKEHWNLVKQGNREDIWDIQWTFTCWLNNGITIVPNCNLISNLGFNEEATHTKSSLSKLAKLPTKNIGVISHPFVLNIDRNADYYTFTNYNLLESSRYILFRNWLSGKIPVSMKKNIKKILR